MYNTASEDKGTKVVLVYSLTTTLSVMQARHMCVCMLRLLGCGGGRGEGTTFL